MTDRAPWQADADYPHHVAYRDADFCHRRPLRPAADRDIRPGARLTG
ncbi:hypothetical protein [Amycolatopsis sp. TNS106]|nr:hypothetical protein [Amycolatopsis sp. TNS106]